MDTIMAVGKLFHDHDFTCIAETRENFERKALMKDFIKQWDCAYFSSYIDQYKGGVGIVIKNAFLKSFRSHHWKVISKGRLGRLSLQGDSGTLHIYVVYLHPSDKCQQKQAITTLNKHLDPNAHSIITGDFNFVIAEADRYSKHLETWSWGDDKPVAEKWEQDISALGIQEWSQDSFTYEGGICFSRLDRVYSSLHPCHYIEASTFCNVLPKPLGISDHNPISFGLRNRSKSKDFHNVPAWIMHHPAFEHELNAEFEFALQRVHSSSTTGFDKLQLFKQAVKKASRIIRVKYNLQEAIHTESKLAATMGFIRAAKLQDVDKMKHFQKI